ncbi:hypothetical protein CEE37_00475 [candidate division LCP-89 bacterium B3_LCP]|uniref:Secretion system C-terminal sorting domain-containing protein n=1 Tax=candidate division LCP-89 bacterium B3_LCP TaxID=2012998 RepID=A0A532V4R1_UNCL8|nr:MAG: hypothetical protein CEE37_00475 [candidate division LCP-89 bacterium B3_LCP]
MYSICFEVYEGRYIMRSVIAISLILSFSTPIALSQESWVMLTEYPSPGDGARGLYYAGKLLWNVDHEAQTVFTLNPYNLEVIDIYPSPIDDPWGITVANNRFWMTNFSNSVSQLVKLRPDTFAVAATFDFPGYYFYGLTCDSTNQHMWISAMDHSYTKYLLEFDAITEEVIQWHSWPYIWNLGMQYWDRCLWVNSSDWNYPDYTYIFALDSMNVEEMLTCPLAVPEGIATNGVVWWISHFRDNAPYIWKLIPPGAEVHDIAGYQQVFPNTGILEQLEFEPQSRFINYGSVSETDVPFVCRIWEDTTAPVIYYDSLIYNGTIAPEEIVDITFDTAYFEPNRDYTLKLYSSLPWDQHRNNDTLRVYVHTVGGIHDLAILSILEPEESEPLELIIPTIEVQNQGDYFEATAPVHLEIVHPDSTISEYDSQVLDLDPLEIDTIYFSPFDPTESGEYVFEFDGMLPDDYNPGNDYIVMMCAIGLVHDVAPAEVVSPEAFEPLQPITPRVIVENLGDYDEPLFPVSCTVEDSVSTVYSEQGYCQPLEPGEQWEVVFYNFYPQYPTNYIFNFTTLLTGDQVPENDTLSITSAVGLIYDVAPIDVIEPTQIIGPEPFTPSVMVKNEGNVFADGFFIHCQVDSESVSLYNMQTWLPALNPNETDTAFFDMITLSNLGEYRFLFISDWQLDNYPENDTLEFWPEYLSVIDGKDALHISDFHVEGAFPNPFNSQTVFEISLPEVASIDVSLFDLSGCCVHQMNFDPLTPGVHRIELKVSNLPSGMYIARVSTEKWEESIKVVLLK